MKIDVHNLKELRGRPCKYPWGKLQNINDYFLWKTISDRRNIQAAAIKQNMKVSVRLYEGELLVIRKV